MNCPICGDDFKEVFAISNCEKVCCKCCKNESNCSDCEYYNLEVEKYKEKFNDIDEDINIDEDEEYMFPEDVDFIFRGK